MEFTPSSLGSVTAGTWAMYFDGSDVALTGTAEDVDALAVGPGEISLSTSGNFSVAGVAGADEDAFTFEPMSLGESTSGDFQSTLAFDGSLLGLDANDVGGLDLP